MMYQSAMKDYFDRLWPICRSITGDGLRESLSILSEIIPLEITEVPSGKAVFDWEIPLEWNIKDAWIEGPGQKRFCEFKVNNLHLVNYSIPINSEISFEELDAHLYSIPSQPDAIPYITSYYKDHWGFCLKHSQREKLDKTATYKVFIDAEKKQGSLSYGQFLLKGESEKEILFSTYLCHPSMAINELSGPLVTAFLYKAISTIKNRKFSYRFVFVPETIGAIAFLHEHGQHLLNNLHAGYVITCVGHNGQYTYKRSRRGNSEADRIAEHILKFENADHEILNFSVGGSDERQYCAPGFNLPVGSLMRTMYKKYPEYHTSLDNEKILSYEGLESTVQMYSKIVKALEINHKYESTIKYCEPQLGKRGLYPNSGAWLQNNVSVLDMLHFLAHADGETEMLRVAELADKSILHYSDIIDICRNNNIIK